MAVGQRRPCASTTSTSTSATSLPSAFRPFGAVCGVSLTAVAGPAVVITASLDRGWVKPLAALRSRGVACVVVSLDVPAFERREQEEAARRAGTSAADSPLPQPSATAQEWRALRHDLA